MKEDLVLFKTALLAKEKGFDIPIRQENQVYDTDSGEIDECLQSGQVSDWNKLKYQKICSAPTQSLLQKWLRDKHKIFVGISTFKDHQADVNDPYRFQIHLDWYGYKDAYGLIGYFDSYEEALEEGLQEALKLIK